MSSNILLSTALKNIYSHLADEESRDLFMPRFEHIFYDNKHIEALFAMMKRAIQWDINRSPAQRRIKLRNLITIGEYLKQRNAYDRICIWGAGYQGWIAMRVLKMLGLPVECFVDNDKTKIGGCYFDKPVISPEEVFSNYPNIYILLGLWSPHLSQVVQQLQNTGFPNERTILMFSSEEQYFGTGLIKPCADEVYFDVGVFDGATINNFMEFSEGNYKLIVGMEADKANYDYLIDKYKHESNLSLINKGAWNKSEILRFDSNPHGGLSKIDETGEATIETTTIDKIAEELQIAPTFIKMDIEGAELKALEGAKEIITSCRPRMAIGVYHKAEDIVDILHYILQLVPEYKFYLRQHSYNMAETVLYCVI